MTAFAAFAIFPVLTLLLVALARAERGITASDPLLAEPAAPLVVSEISSE